MQAKYFDGMKDGRKMKDYRSAEFLVHGYLPLEAVKWIRVSNQIIHDRLAPLMGGRFKIDLRTKPNWYF